MKNQRKLLIKVQGIKQTTLNAGKTKYLFFHKQNAGDSILLRFPIITFNSIEIKHESFVKLLGVIIHENIT